MQWAGAFSEPVTAVPHNTFGEPMYSFARVRRSRRIAVAGLAVLALAASGSFAANAATPPPAHNNGTVGLKQVGPIDETNGFPLWYKDTNNVRLELCLDPSDANCIMGDLPEPGPAGLVPGQLPGRGVLVDGRLPRSTPAAATRRCWSRRRRPPSALPTGCRPRAARSASAGSGSGPPAWSTVRTYTVTHPYGVDHIDAEAGAVKGINTTEDIGVADAGRDRSTRRSPRSRRRS